MPALAAGGDHVDELDCEYDETEVVLYGSAKEDVASSICNPCEKCIRSAYMALAERKSQTWSLTAGQGVRCGSDVLGLQWCLKPV